VLFSITARSHEVFWYFLALLLRREKRIGKAKEMGKKGRIKNRIISRTEFDL